MQLLYQFISHLAHFVFQKTAKLHPQNTVIEQYVVCNADCHYTVSRCTGDEHLREVVLLRQIILY